MRVLLEKELRQSMPAGLPGLGQAGRRRLRGRGRRAHRSRRRPRPLLSPCHTASFLEPQQRLHVGELDGTIHGCEWPFRSRHSLPALTEGGVLCLDEIDNSNPSVLTVLNSALANGYCSFPNGMPAKHKDLTREDLRHAGSV